MFRPEFLLAGFIALSGPTRAQAPATLTVDRAWARATAPHQVTGVIYLTMHATKAVGVISVSSTDAGMAMMHRTSESGGMSSMSDLGKLDMVADQTVRFSPGGLHIMLMGLHHPLVPGAHVNLSLGLSDGTSVRLDVPVQPIGADGPPG